jgi:hypothetical protein
LFRKISNVGNIQDLLVSRDWTVFVSIPTKLRKLKC